MRLAACGAGLVMAFLGACSSPEKLSDDSSAEIQRLISQGKAQRLSLRGRVVRLVPKHHSAVIQHETVEGWMQAMTMEFVIQDGRDYASLHAGDRIRATLFVAPVSGGSRFWLSAIEHEFSQSKRTLTK